MSERSVPPHMLVVDDGPAVLHPLAWAFLTALVVCSSTTEAPPASPPPRPAWRGHTAEATFFDEALIIDDPLPARAGRPLPARPTLPAVPAPGWAQALSAEERLLPRSTRRALARRRRAST